MKKNNDLIKNTIIIALGKICTQFMSFFLLPLYTNVLSTTEYGIVDLIITYVSLFVPLVTLQLEMAVFRQLIEYRTDKKKQALYIYNALTTITKITIFLSMLYFVVMILIKCEYKWYLLAIVISTIYSNILLQISRGKGDNVGYATGSALSGITTLVLNIIFLKVLNLRLEGILVSISIANVLCFIYLFIKEKTYCDIKNEKKDLNIINEMLKYSIPLIPNGIMWWIINVSDRTIISLILGTASNGIYAISNKFSNLFVSLYNIYSLSWTEQASIHIKDDDKDKYFTNVFYKSMILFFCICIGILGCIPVIFPIMIDVKYNDAYNYIPVLLIGMFFNALVSMLGAIYIGEKKTKEVAKTSVYSAIINIITNFLFIKFFGIWSAAISTVIAFFLMYIYRIIDVQKYVRIKFSFLIYFEMIIVFSIVIFLYYLKIRFFNIILLLFVVAYFLMKNISFFNDILKVVSIKIIKMKNDY